MRIILISLVLTAALLASVLTVGQVFSGDSGDPDHILIYKAKAKVKDQVVLDDQFADKTFNVKKLKGLGAPALKNSPGYGYFPDHTLFHYTSYRIKRAKGESRHIKVNKTVTDQFGTIELQVRAPNRMLVPAFKTLVGPAPDAPTPSELSNNVIDHYVCYKVKPLDPFTPVQVTVTDQFIDPLNLGVTKEVEVKKPQRLCAPVKKTHGGDVFDINNPDGEAGPHLMCYKIELLDDDEDDKIAIWTGDQFLEKKIKAKTEEPKQLCVPAEK